MQQEFYKKLILSLFLPAKVAPKSEAPVATSTSDSGGGSGKRKRKIQLVTTNRGDQISLVSYKAAIDTHFHHTFALWIFITVTLSLQPPPPELGYTITVKDLDMEKKAALSQIQKVLEEPGMLSSLSPGLAINTMK